MAQIINGMEACAPDIFCGKLLSSLIWVQTICKGYQQKALVGKELKDNIFHFSLHWLIGGNNTAYKLPRARG